ncbi:MAG: pyrroline-5-carboxylate reductase, partial [Actinobacteria bacterium]|nr:pyrroline-5-carboxylate reductase [Actinomycetota bacterium]
YGLTSGTLHDAEAVILAVKPQDLDKCVEEFKVELSGRVLLVSLLAGVKSSRISEAIGREIRIIRTMPNTPILLLEGMSAIAKGENASDNDLAWVERVLSQSGKTVILEETQLDAVTAVSGSGPAYFFGFVEAMIKAAIRLGLSEQDSKLLVNQTLIGAAKMIEESGKDAGTLRKEVTSPNGTTAAALASFESSGWEETVYEAMKAAKDRSEELSN